MCVSEKDQLVATQIAYADLDVAWKMHSNNGKNSTPLTLEQAIVKASNQQANLGGLADYIKSINNDGTVTFIEGYEHIGSWTLLSAQNENASGQSGFYGCILDTGDSRILASRGSESMDNMLNFKQDWVDADLKLLNSEQTIQEAALREYMVANKDLLTEKPWVATGHSLGGALSDHAAVISYEENIGNFSGAINFDGPGHSQEYIKQHSEALSAVSGQMIHKKASLVGNLLYDLPGVKQDYIQTQRENRFNSDEYVEGISFWFLEHDTKHWVIDENGNTVEGRQEVQEWVLEKLTRLIDRLPPEIGNILPDFIYVTVVGAKTIGDFLKENPILTQAIVSAVVANVILNPAIVPMTLALVAEIIVVVAVVIIVAIAVEVMIEAFEALAKAVVDAVCNAVDWLKGKAAELFDHVNNFINGLKQSFREKFNRGVSYVRNNPYFSADPEKLREYARRLANVNNRLAVLDRGMRGLYWQVGLLDLWDILCSNVITSQSYSLNRAKKYLNNTANRLENADNKAKNYMGG